MGPGGEDGDAVRWKLEAVDRGSGVARQRLDPIAPRPEDREQSAGRGIAAAKNQQAGGRRHVARPDVF